MSWLSRHRRIVLAPLIVLLLLVGVKLISMSWLSSSGAAAYGDARYGASATAFDRLQLLNVIEPWRAHFGEGATRFRDGDLEGAEAAFRRALDLAPDNCEARFNLVLTIEAQGDRLTGGETRVVEESERQDGLARYRVALDIANAGLCPASEESDAGERIEQARDRLRVKLGAEGSDDGEELELPPEQRDDNQEGEEASPQEEQLTERNQTGAAEREDAADIDPREIQPPDKPNW